MTFCFVKGIFFKTTDSEDIRNNKGTVLKQIVVSQLAFKTDLANACVNLEVLAEQAIARGAKFKLVEGRGSRGYGAPMTPFTAPCFAPSHIKTVSKTEGSFKRRAFLFGG